MPLTHHDVLFVGMQRRSYIAAIEASQRWETTHIDKRTGVAYFDTTYIRAADVLATFPDVSILYVANELELPSDITMAACKKWIEVLRDRKHKPLIVLQEDSLDLVDVFATNGYTVELRSDTGTVEDALKILTTG